MEHLPLPECEPQLALEKCRPLDAPRGLSSRVYAAVLSAVISSQALETVDIDVPACMWRRHWQALDVSLETHEAAVSNSLNE